MKKSILHQYAKEIKAALERGIPRRDIAARYHVTKPALDSFIRRAKAEYAFKPLLRNIPNEHLLFVRELREQRGFTFGHISLCVEQRFGRIYTPSTLRAVYSRIRKHESETIKEV